MPIIIRKRHFLGFLFFLNAAAVSAQQVDFPHTQLLWGDTHLHSKNSTDAYENGQVNADIDTAYRFASGLPVIHPANGNKIQINAPLDFLVVADHAELLGLQTRLEQQDPVILSKPAGRRMYEMFIEAPTRMFGQIIAISLTGANQDVKEQLHTPEVIQGAWETQIAAAERYNKPGQFSTLIGWEWSSSANSINQHRVVFTADGGDVARQFLPFSSYDSENPKDLWRWLQETADRTGARLMAIPHNSNISDGQMFDYTDLEGNDLTAEYARERMKWEKVAEVTQYKGTSETHPALSVTDEFANFEIRNNLFNGRIAEPSQGSYLRGALLRGLEIASGTGENPFQLGMIGSTDSHTGLSSVEENIFLGKTGADALPQQRLDKVVSGDAAWTVGATGLAAVWARENTREAIFNAFQRREVYATTGPRIQLRFFAGFNFNNIDIANIDLAEVGYEKGVSMGGELSQAPEGLSPGFIIQAVKDINGASLDRIQIIKGWVDSEGQSHEKIYDVSWSGNRKIDEQGNLPAIRSTVDLTRATYSNELGETELLALWEDPDFNPDLSAFYYVRVLEIPTPRHHVYDAVALGVDVDTLELNQPDIIQERAYSSPIWYIP